MCAHIVPMPCEPAGRNFRGLRSRAEHAAAHHSRENAGWGFAAAERSSRAHDYA